MAVSEFGLIQRYFTVPLISNPVNTLSVGDDCALMTIPEGYELAVTVDTMVEGVHFFAGANPEQLGRKLLAVNLSDLAAMGAAPVSITLALTLSEVNESWLQSFSKGLLDLARDYSIDLVGGDTAKGPLTLSVQAMGIVPKEKALKRSTAKVGDIIFVTGIGLGDSGLGLKAEQGYQGKFSSTVLKKFHTPEPRVEEGLKLREYASSCIDLSDGIASDLPHILEGSSVGALLHWDSIPLSESVKEYIRVTGDWQMPLVAGEDYELCFTVAPQNIDSINIECTKVGVVQSLKGLRLMRNDKIKELKVKGFEHFS